MFGRKKLKKEIERLKGEISFLNNQQFPILETTKYDVNAIGHVMVMGVEAEKATTWDIDYAKQLLVDSICKTLKKRDNIEKYIEFEQIKEDDGLLHMTATIRVLRKQLGGK